MLMFFRCPKNTRLQLRVERESDYANIFFLEAMTAPPVPWDMGLAGCWVMALKGGGFNCLSHANLVGDVICMAK